MTRNEIENIVRESYAARRIGDIEATAAYFAEDATFRISACEALGDLGTPLRGKSDLRGLWGTVFPTYDWSEFPIRSIMIDDGTAPPRAVVHCAGTMVYTPTGQRFEAETLDMLTFENGKITDFLEFVDTHMLFQILEG